MELMDSQDYRIPVHRVNPQWLAPIDVVLDILRLDLLHPTISGNKWFKLKPYLLAAQDVGQTAIMSFGGAWSNHIHALAAAGQAFSFKTIGIIRGEQPKLTAMLQDACCWGMYLHSVCRQDYRKRYSLEYQQLLIKDLGEDPKKVAIIPEGGHGALGIKGCESILSTAQIKPCRYDQIWLACGTGSTMAGVINSVNQGTKVQGVAVLKGADFLRSSINKHLLSTKADWVLDTDSHCGGYGKAPIELLDFIDEFELDTGVPLDHVYTGKVMLALKKKIRQGGIPKGSHILMVHTGGLQGKRGIKNK